MLQIDIPPYKKEYVDGWLVLMEEGLFVKRRENNCIELKNDEGKVIRIVGSREDCDRCLKGMEAIPDYDKYMSCIHLDYTDIDYLLFKGDQVSYSILTWNIEFEDLSKAQDDLTTLIHENVDSIKRFFIFIYGNFKRLDRYSQFLGAIDGMASEDADLMFQVLLNENEASILCALFQ